MRAWRRNGLQLRPRLIVSGIAALVLPSSASAQLDSLLRQFVQPPSYGAQAPYPTPYPSPGYRAPPYPKNDIVLQGGLLDDECAALYVGPNEHVPEAERVNT